MKNLSKDILLKKIETVEDAKKFIEHLSECGKIFHFDDDPIEIESFTPYESHYVSLRITELFNKSFDWGEHDDCFGYALYLLYNN